jgi:RNA polymerase sigma factor (sigma-70 family)
VEAREISRRFREGDADAVRAVYRLYGRLVYGVAYKVLGDSGLAEEATQQAFLKAWRAASGFDEDRDIAPWLAAIVRRVAIDIYRRETLRSTEPLEFVAPGHPALVSPDSADSAYDVWEVRQAVTELPDPEQEIVRLQHFEGLTHGQIAERLRIAPGTVKSRSFRAHKRLAALLGHLRE